MPVYNHYYPDNNNQINTPESALRLMLAGPTIPVAVSLTPEHVELLTKLQLPVPDPVSGTALIDTGATFCMVDEAIIGQLGIPPTGSTPIAGVSGGKDHLTYPASLSFPGTPIPNIVFTDMIGAQLSAAGIIAIIGRNVLQYYVFVFNGPGGHMSLSF